jgi:hypothetical protein
MAEELFELELLGGPVETRYRRVRPEIEAMPWGTLDVSRHPPALVAAARDSWTRAAFQEHRTGIAMALTLKALMEARAPLDLIALATRFPLDELVHVELCSRMAMELGGAVPIVHDPDRLVARPLEGVDPLLRCGDLIVRFFCVGEALSIPMLRGTMRASEHPLPRAVLGRIVRDEAAHGAFGWMFLDWALPHYAAHDLEVLARAADQTIDRVKDNWEAIRKRPKGPKSAVHSLGWMETDAYLELAERSLERNVLRPLRARGLPVRSTAGAPAGVAGEAPSAGAVGYDSSGSS